MQYPVLRRVLRCGADAGEEEKVELSALLAHLDEKISDSVKLLKVRQDLGYIEEKKANENVQANWSLSRVLRMRTLLHHVRAGRTPSSWRSLRLLLGFIGVENDEESDGGVPPSQGVALPWKRLGAVVFFIPRTDRLQWPNVLACEVHDEALLAVLDWEEELDWKALVGGEDEEVRGVMFPAFCEVHVPTLAKALAARGLEVREYGADVWVYHAELCEALRELEMPDGVEVAPLREEHTKLVDSNWTYTGPGTDELVRGLIRTHPTRAAFVDGEPVAWILTQGSGAMGMAFTQPEHRRKGLARLVATALAREHVRERGYAFCYIVTSNASSHGLFSSLGFFKGDSTPWVHVMPAES